MTVEVMCIFGGVIYVDNCLVLPVLITNLLTQCIFEQYSNRLKERYFFVCSKSMEKWIFIKSDVEKEKKKEYF